MINTLYFLVYEDFVLGSDTSLSEIRFAKDKIMKCHNLKSDVKIMKISNIQGLLEEVDTQ